MQDFNLHPVKPPHIPPDLVWYHHEPQWQGIAQDALAKSLKKVKVRLEYHEDFSINSKRAQQLAAGLGFFAHQAGVRWFRETEERLEEQMDTVWEYSASFGTSADAL
jgi:hypothetical protein